MRRAGAVLAVLASGLLLAGCLQPGQIDTAFGPGGTVTSNFGEPRGAAGVAVQADGNILVVGRGSVSGVGRFALARYRPDGGPDPSFGGGGTVITPIGNGSEATAVVLQPDQRAVVVGNAIPPRGGTLGFAVARYNVDGTLDTTFGQGGVVITDFGPLTMARAVSLQADGKIVVLGDSTGSMALARYNPDGSGDATFGWGGVVRSTQFGGLHPGPMILVHQADGKLIAGSTASKVGDHAGTGYFRLVRYLPNGIVDGSFGGDGLVMTGFKFGSTHDSFLAGLALRPGGRLLAVGTTVVETGAGAFAFVRYNEDGTRDPSFGTDGRVVQRYGSVGVGATAMLTQTLGRFILAGITADSGYVLFARFAADGSFDASFGSGGVAATSALRRVSSLAVHPGNRFLATEAEDFKLARFGS